MRKWLAAALFVPSFYGFVTWGTTLALYSLRLIDWHASSARSMAVFLAVLSAVYFRLTRSWSTT